MLSKGKRIAGICGMVAPVVAVSSILLAIQNSDFYDFTTIWDSALSYLGAWDDVDAKRSAPFFNLGLIISGFMLSPFVYGLFRSLSHIVGRIGSLGLSLSGMSAAGVGILYLGLPYHGLSAVLFFVTLPISLYMIGAGFLLEKKKLFGLGTVLTAVIITVFTIDFFSPEFIDVGGLAVPEFAVVATGSIWIFILAVGLLIRKY